MIRLADVIVNLRDELDAARLRGAEEDLRFELGPVELEVSVTVQKDAGGNAKVRFWVVEMGVDGKVSSTATQRIKLTLNPRLSSTAAAAQSPLSDQAPFIAGKTEKNER